MDIKLYCPKCGAYESYSEIEIPIYQVYGDILLANDDYTRTSRVMPEGRYICKQCETAFIIEEAGF